MKISVLGMGYVGSVSAACLSNAGHYVVGVDINCEKVDAINAGNSPVLEPGIDKLVADAVESGQLKATTNLNWAINETEVSMVCVGTPSRLTGELDLSAVKGVCRDIGHAIAVKGVPHALVIRSTMLPGSVDKILLPELYKAIGTGNANLLSIAVNPEFMREGSAIKDFSHPPITVVGCDDSGIVDVIRRMYSGVDAPFMHTSIRTAEMLKYASNSYHALKVSFANEIGNACEVLGADAQEVMKIFCMDTKLNVSPAYLRPGFAFGGSCLPKDVRALIHATRHCDLDMPVISRIMPSNDRQIQQGIDRVLATGRRRVGVLGLAFKPETDDLRESPMVTLVESLIGKGCDVRVYDRNVNIARLTGANKAHIEETIPHITTLMCESEQEILSHSDVLVVTSGGEVTQRIARAVKPEQMIVDLTQGGSGLPCIDKGEVQWNIRDQGQSAVKSASSPSLFSHS
jgi:GDP-mannose 6-dehydrogenase